MRTKKQIKGDSLEVAVKAVEKAIFEHNPELKDCKYEIESNKIEVIKGVRYEIDVLVKIFKGDGYDSLFIFECKNHSKNVKWEDASKLNEKIKVLNAQKGFLIANGFSKPTKEFIKNNNLENKIELVESIDFFGNNIDFPIPSIDFNNCYKMRDIKIIIFRKDRNNNTQIQVNNLSNLSCTYNGSEINLNDNIINPTLASIKTNKENYLKKQKLPDGEYEQLLNETSNYTDLFVDGFEIEKIEYKFKCTYIKKKIYPKVISRFDIGKRGKFLSMEFEDVDARKLIFELSTYGVDENK